MIITKNLRHLAGAFAAAAILAVTGASYAATGASVGAPSDTSRPSIGSDSLAADPVQSLQREDPGPQLPECRGIQIDRQDGEIIMYIPEWALQYYGAKSGSVSLFLDGNYYGDVTLTHFSTGWAYALYKSADSIVVVLHNNSGSSVCRNNHWF